HNRPNVARIYPGEPVVSTASPDRTLWLSAPGLGAEKGYNLVGAGSQWDPRLPLPAAHRSPDTMRACLPNFPLPHVRRLVGAKAEHDSRGALPHDAEEPVRVVGEALRDRPAGRPVLHPAAPPAHDRLD